jgi:hypothetical protein
MGEESHEQEERRRLLATGTLRSRRFARRDDG